MLSLVCFKLSLNPLQEHSHRQTAKYLSCPFHIVHFYEEIQDLPEIPFIFINHTIQASRDLK